MGTNSQVHVTKNNTQTLSLFWIFETRVENVAVPRRNAKGKLNA